MFFCYLGSLFGPQESNTCVKYHFHEAQTRILNMKIQILFRNPQATDAL